MAGVAGDQAVGEEQDRCADDGSKPGRGIGETLQGVVDMEELGSGPAAG